MLRFFGYQRPRRVGVPVVVIGNVLVGGTGKTPLLIDLALDLQDRGWKPGVVSRGYGGSARIPSLVDAHGGAAAFGDEPILIRYLARVPVAVGRDRVAAARVLLAAHKECNLILSDDGLQHRRLARDLEICVVNSRGMGNGLLLPAGPLRDPPKRLAKVDAVVLNGITPPVRIYSPFFRMETRIEEAISIADAQQRMSLAALVLEQKEKSLRILAACALGTPDGFFSMLGEAGLRFATLALPDHAALDVAALRGPWDRILVTEKDAVKCYRDPALSRDSRLWVVPLHAEVDPALADFVDARLRSLAHGSAPA